MDSWIIKEHKTIAIVITEAEWLAVRDCVERVRNIGSITPQDILPLKNLGEAVAFPRHDAEVVLDVMGR